MKRILPELREGPAPTPAPMPQAAPASISLRPAVAACGVDRITLPAARPFRIGRDSSNDLQLFDKRIAGHHARVDYRDGVFVLTDLGSSHAVTVNDKPLGANEGVPIKPGDQIDIAGLEDHRFAVEVS
jgi:predicted component of type VI protein secretion system